jgi:hypothetical protein
VARPEGMEALEGSTYKIKTPLDDHAMYVTINDIILNAGTEHEQRRPFEIFINSKNMDHFQWIVALTRLMSAVFRKGGDVTFLAEELQAVFDPKGGYFKPGGKFMPSIIAEIGAVIEHHLQKIGLMEKEELSEQQQLILDQKRAEAEASADKRNRRDDRGFQLPRIGDPVQQVPHQGRRDHGQLRHLPVLRLLEVRLVWRPLTETELLHLLWIAPLLLLIFFLSSPRYRGDIAESRVRRLLATGLEPTSTRSSTAWCCPAAAGPGRSITWSCPNSAFS